MEKIIKYIKFQKQLTILFRDVSMLLLTNDFIKSKYPDLLRTGEGFFLELQQVKLINSKPFHRSCTSCYADNLLELLTLHKNQNNQIQTIMNRHFELKADALIEFEGSYYSNESPHLTNEIAERLFKVRPDIFERFDPTWKSKEISFKDAEIKIEAESLGQFFDIAPVVEAPSVYEAEPMPLIDYEILTQPKLLKLVKDRKLKIKSKKKIDLIEALLKADKK